jgi:hypothetical protein
MGIQARLPTRQYSSRTTQSKLLFVCRYGLLLRHPFLCEGNDCIRYIGSICNTKVGGLATVYHFDQ